MKLKTAIILFPIGFVVVGIVWTSVSRWYVTSRDYRQAEPLVQTIWPMSRAMKHFSKEYGRSPSSLDEIASHEPNLDVSPLRAHYFEFTPNGSRVFFLRVNSRFAFAINPEFAPYWSQPTGFFGKPTNPK